VVVVVVVKVTKGQSFPVHAMKMYKWSRSLAIHILNLGTR